MPIEIKLTNELKKQAQEHASERLRYEFDRFHLDDDVRTSMILIGTIGQLIFKNYLDEKKIQYDFEFQAGNYDNYDFKINNNIFEIKCSAYDDKYEFLNLLYSEDQYQRGLLKNYKYCVQIFINGYNRKNRLLDLNKCDKGIIYGAILFDKIAAFKNRNKKYFGDDYKIPLKYLRSLEEFIQQTR